MFGVLTEWDGLSVTWYDTLEAAQTNCYAGDTLIVALNKEGE